MLGGAWHGIKTSFTAGRRISQQTYSIDPMAVGSPTGSEPFTAPGTGWPSFVLGQAGRAA
jgi:hypothetical protein